MGFSSWLENHALEERITANAYESYGDYERSVLKLCIARLYTFWGELPAETAHKTFRQGFTAKIESNPASASLFLCPSNYARPECFLAAALPALLAGVERVIPIFIHPENDDGLSEGLGAAVELAGLEESSICTAGEALGAFPALREEFPDARIITLGKPAFGEQFIIPVLHLGLPFIHLDEKAGEEGISLDDGHIGTWLWPDIGPAWFMSRHISLREAE